MDSFPEEEIKTCLKVMLNPLVNTSVERVIWDIDKNFIEICHWH